MNKTFLDCKQNGNTIISRTNENYHFITILLESVYYEFVLNHKGEVIKLTQSAIIPDFLDNPKIAKYNVCCFSPQMN
jgi:hypothetical protein